MKLHLDFTPIKNELEKLEKQSVTVGVLNHGVTAAKMDLSRPMTSLTTLSGTTPRRYAALKGRSKNIKLRKLAFILDEKRGIFSDVLINPNNRDLMLVAQELAVLNKTPNDIKRLENAARALVRNPIMRGDYNPNAASTIARKEFNHWGFATGTLFKNITAVYKKW